MPDGKYIVKFKDEIASYDEFFLVLFEVTRGEFNGDTIAAKHTSAKAKKVTRDYTGDYLSRLSFEGDKKGIDLSDTIFRFRDMADKNRKNPRPLRFLLSGHFEESLNRR